MTSSSLRPDVILSARGISKRFPGVQALDGVELDLTRGTVHAICGENGAGKSTLMKVLAGLCRPDSGSLFFRGREQRFRDPLAARNAGILLVHQELSLVDHLSVADNIFLGSHPTRLFGALDHRRLWRDAQELLSRLQCDFSVRDKVGELSMARKQLVEIARALAFKADVVIFDEPTTSLSEQEAGRLFGVIKQLAADGAAVAYISHRMKEIFAVSDRITILRDGKVSGNLDTKACDADEVGALMVGRRLDRHFARASSTAGGEVLRVDRIRARGVQDVTFDVRSGEVVGLYGLVGSGRTEIAEALFGLRPLEGGRILWKGRERRIDSPGDAIGAGIGFVPEDRKQDGLILGLSASANLSLAALPSISAGGMLSRRGEHRLFDSYRRQLRIAVASPLQLAGTLSGGNQQKIVIAKWLAASPELLILDEPTRGIDVGAKAEIHGMIASLAEQGLAVLVISSEMPEIMGIAHRILTVAEGRLTAEFRHEAFTEEALLAAATVRKPPGQRRSIV